MSSSAESPGVDAPSQPVISAVYLTGATLTLWLAKDQVAGLVDTACQGLAPHLTLLLDEDARLPAALYPVLVDVWQLSDGRLELAGLTQHQWSELAYGTLGGALGAGIGALRGASLGLVEGFARGRGADRASAGQLAGLLPLWQGMLSGSLRGGLEGVGRGVGGLGSVGRRLSENSARALGNYSEVMFSIPAVRVANETQRSLAGPFSLSLGVFTDSRPACAIDKNFRFGLGKTLATIDFGKPGQASFTRVIDGAGREVLSASLRSSTRLEQPLGLLAHWLEAPLLGIHRANRGSGPLALRCSALRRNFGAATVYALGGEVHLPCGPFGLPSRSWDLRQASSSAPLEAPLSIGYENVWSEITLPSALS